MVQRRGFDSPAPLSSPGTALARPGRQGQDMANSPDPKPPKRIKDPDLMRRLHLELRGEPCELCEQRPGVALHHKVLRGRGGPDARENLAWLCRPCHDLIHGV